MTVTLQPQFSQNEKTTVEAAYFKEVAMFKKGKLLKGAVASIAAACMLTAAAFAYTGTGTVKVSTYLNVRQSSSISSPIIGKIYNGTSVKIVGSVSGWYQISYNGGTAWVSSAYVVTSAASKRQVVVNAAKSALGTKYAYGGTTPGVGMDCSGLTLYAYSKIGVTLPHSSSMQSKMGTWVARANLLPGDLVFFNTAGNGTAAHCGVYIGNGTFINAQSGLGQVASASLSNSYWSRVYLTARRIIQ